MTKVITLPPDAVIGNEYSGMGVHPIGGLYYKNCSYRVRIDLTIDQITLDEVHAVLRKNFYRDFDADDSDKGANASSCSFNKLNEGFFTFKSETIRTYIKLNAAGNVRFRRGDTYLDVYCQHKQDFELVVCRFRGAVIKLHGVTSLVHLELLNDPRYVLIEKDRPFFNQFEYRVKISSSHNFRSYFEAIKKVREGYRIMTAFLEVQASKSEYKLRKEHNTYFSVFCNEELAFSVLPLARFDMPDTTYAITRALCPE